jgi:hypothetical protein
METKHLLIACVLFGTLLLAEVHLLRREGRWCLGRGFGLCQRGQCVLDGEPDQTRQVADTQLVHQATAVRLHSLEGRGNALEGILPG